MKHRSTLFLCLTPFLLACGGGQTSSSTPATTSSPAGSPEQTSIPATTSQTSSGEQYLFYQIKEGQTKDGLEGAPWVNSTKEGIANKLVKPSQKDDFYLHKTYDMQVNAKLEEGDIAIGGMPGAIKAISERTTKILTEKTSSTYSDTLRGIYSLYSKEDKSAEIQYVKGQIDEIKAINSLDNLANYLYEKGYDSVWPLFELVHYKKGNVLLKEENMGLTPSSVNYSYIHDNDAGKQRVINSTVFLLGLYGYNEADAKALLDSAANAYRYATEGGFDSLNTTVAELDTQFPHLRLKDYFTTKLGYASTDTVTIEGNIKRLLSSMSEAWNASQEQTTLNLQKIKDILIFRKGFISAISRSTKGENNYIDLTGELNSNTRGFNEDMYIKDIFGTYFTNVYDHVYIDNYETKERRASIISLMNDVTAEYKVLLNNSAWLDQSTRQEAVAKLDAMTFDACYPLSLESLPAWNYTVPTTFMQSVNDYMAWSRLASQPINENYPLWGNATVTTVNGIYNPMGNAFVIFDGLLATDSYGKDMSKEELYGSIGAVIGHEISHAFDVSGSQYDKDGSQRDWWTSKDKQAYAAKVEKIKSTWSQYENKPNMKLSCDEGMLGEIIADMGGVSVCLRLGAKETSFNYDKFFTAYANMHGCIMSEQSLQMLVYGGEEGKQDSHPIPVFRVNGVVNQFDKFYETYNIKENDKMYVASADRLNIWG